MEAIDWTGPQGGALAMAFAAGVLFITPILWNFAIKPLQAKVDKLEQQRIKRDEDDIRLYRDLALKAAQT